MSGFYVTDRHGQPCQFKDTQQDAIDWAVSCAPNKPPKGFRWEVWRSDGVRVAVVKYNPTLVIDQSAA